MTMWIATPIVCGQPLSSGHRGRQTHSLGSECEEIIDVESRQSDGYLPKCAHVLVLPDEGVFGQHGRILFSGGRDNELIRWISVKRLRQSGRPVAECGGEGHGSELGHLECDTKPLFGIAGNPYSFFLQQLTKLPCRYH